MRGSGLRAYVSDSFKLQNAIRKTEISRKMNVLEQRVL